MKEKIPSDLLTLDPLDCLVIFEIFDYFTNYELLYNALYNNEVFYKEVYG